MADEVMVMVTLETDSCTSGMKVPQSHVDTILQYHNFVAVYGNPALEIKTLPLEGDDD